MSQSTSFRFFLLITRDKGSMRELCVQILDRHSDQMTLSRLFHNKPMYIAWGLN